MNCQSLDHSSGLHVSLVSAALKLEYLDFLQAVKAK